MDLFFMSYTSHRALLIVGYADPSHISVAHIHCEGILTSPDN